MIRSFLFRQDGELQSDISFDQFREVLSDKSALLWVDIEDPEDADVECLLEVFELHPLTVEDCIMPNIRPKIEEFDHYLFVVMQGIQRNDSKRLSAVELDICLGENFIITVHSEPVRALEDNWSRVSKKSPIIKRGADFLFYSVADSLIDSYFPIIDEVEIKVDELEKRLLSNSVQYTLSDIFSIYDELMILRRTLAPHREILGRLNRAELPFVKISNAIYFRDIYDHLLRMSDMVDACREVTTMSLEAYTTIVSNRLNEIMKTMTAIATLAVPLLIVTGIYGMNMLDHPEIGPVWIYHTISILLLSSLPVMLYFFHKNKWL